MLSSRALFCELVLAAALEGGCDVVAEVVVEAEVALAAGTLAVVAFAAGVSEANLSLSPSRFQAGTRAGAVSAISSNVWFCDCSCQTHVKN